MHQACLIWIMFAKVTIQQTIKNRLESEIVKAVDILVIICTYYTAIFKGVAEHGLGWGVGFNNLYIITPLHKITNLGLEAKLYVE